jgi:hypothetical protein
MIDQGGKGTGSPADLFVKVTIWGNITNFRKVKYYT